MYYRAHKTATLTPIQHTVAYIRITLCDNALNFEIVPHMYALHS